MSDWIPRSILKAPLDLPGGSEAIGRALWLYLALISVANGEGCAHQSRSRLADRLSVPEAEIDRWLVRLVEAKLVHVLSPSPFLVIVLPFWRNNVVAPGESAALHKEVPVSSSNVAAAAATDLNKQLRDGGPGEGAALLAEARDVLGESGAIEVHDLLGHYPAPLVRKALRRVQLTPTTQIRKSKAALFRFLLAKFTDEFNA